MSQEKYNNQEDQQNTEISESSESSENPESLQSPAAGNSESSDSESSQSLEGSQSVLNSQSSENSEGSDKSCASTTTEESPDDYEKLDAKKDENYFYIAREENTNFYKIGITVEPKKRFQNLQTGNPRRLILKKIFKGTESRSVEQELKNEIVNKLEDRKIAEKRGRGGTEWFWIYRKEDFYSFVTSEAQNSGLVEVKVEKN